MNKHLLSLAVLVLSTSGCVELLRQDVSTISDHEPHLHTQSSSSGKTLASAKVFQPEHLAFLIGCYDLLEVQDQRAEEGAWAEIFAPAVSDSLGTPEGPFFTYKISIYSPNSLGSNPVSIVGNKSGSMLEFITDGAILSRNEMGIRVEGRQGVVVGTREEMFHFSVHQVMEVEFLPEDAIRIRWKVSSEPQSWEEIEDFVLKRKACTPS